VAFLFVLPTWPKDVWAAAMKKAAPQLDVRLWPDEAGDPREIEFVSAWLPPPGVISSLPNLKAIFSLGAGVDAILRERDLPNVPIVRINDPDLTGRMAEYVVLHVLMHHRQQRRIDANQKSRVWDSFQTHAASAMTVGIMGLGVMGRASAERLRDLGFKVLGWSQSRKDVPGVRSFAGAAEFDSFLGQTDILVSLLPATPATDGIVNRETIRKLSRSGPLGAPVFINAGRGRQQVEEDVLAALDSGDLLAATLDVFHQEPLPPESRFWTHPKVTLTPHIAADSEPEVICSYIWKQIERYRAGQPFENVVDLKRGY
jgi:glyoxylate/hydroxypyruvate reductase A